MPAPTPDVIITPFGASAGGSYIQLPVPVPSQLPGNPGNASFTDGFPPDTMTPVGSGGIPPRGQDMNGILYMLSAYAQALTGGQFWPYNSTWEAANGGYAIGAMVAMANGAGFWLNTVNDNANNPDTSAANTSGWVPIAAYGKTSLATTGGTTTLTAVQAANPLIIVSGTLTSNALIYLPTWLQSWRIVNNTTGFFAVSVLATGSSFSVPIPQIAGIPFEVTADGAGNLKYGAELQTGAVNGTLTDGVNSGNVILGYIISDGFVCLQNLSPSATIASANGVLNITGLPSALVGGGVDVVVPV